MMGMGSAMSSPDECASRRDVCADNGVIVLNEGVVRALNSLRSIIQLDLVLFFHENPETLDNVRGLTTRLGLLGEDITEAMSGLVSAGVMIQSGEGQRAVYGYATDPAVRAAVEVKIVMRARSREGRVELETEVSQGGEV